MTLSATNSSALLNEAYSNEEQQRSHHRVAFTEPFTQVPELALQMLGIDGESNSPIQSFRAEVSEIHLDYFVVEVSVPSSSHSPKITLQWIANLLPQLEIGFIEEELAKHKLTQKFHYYYKQPRDQHFHSLMFLLTSYSFSNNQHLINHCQNAQELEIHLNNTENSMDNSTNSSSNISCTIKPIQCSLHISPHTLNAEQFYLQVEK